MCVSSVYVCGGRRRRRERDKEVVGNWNVCICLLLLLLCVCFVMCIISSSSFYYYYHPSLSRKAYPPQHTYGIKNCFTTGKFEMQVLLRRESRKGGVILKNRCRFFFDGKKTRFSKMQMALGGEQAGTCFSFVSYVLRFRT